MPRLDSTPTDISVELDGQLVPAKAGEPVACSLWAAGEKVFSRSIKYHRPRGPFCFSGACSQCLMRVDGVPNVQRLGKVNVGQTVPEQLRLDLELERAAVAALNAGVELCRGAGDNGSRDLLEDILKSEEDHIDWIEEQLELIKQVGEAHYLAQQIKEEDA